LTTLRYPLIIISTEDVRHRFRPICFSSSESETIAKVTKLFTLLPEFLLREFQFQLNPKYILTDNSDSFLTASKRFFSQAYTHMSCYFHRIKRVQEKLKKKDLVPFQKNIYYGIKSLRNAVNQEEFDVIWDLIEQYWHEKGVPKGFIETFKSEYIVKDFGWFFESAFPGESRSHHSRESGNSLLKAHFNSKPYALKDFIIGMKKFCRAYSTLEKTEFAKDALYARNILNKAHNIKDKAVVSPMKPGCVYYARKVIADNSTTKNCRLLFRIISIDQMLFLAI